MGDDSTTRVLAFNGGQQAASVDHIASVDYISPVDPQSSTTAPNDAVTYNNAASVDHISPTPQAQSPQKDAVPAWNDAASADYISPTPKSPRRQAAETKKTHSDTRVIQVAPLETDGSAASDGNGVNNSSSPAEERMKSGWGRASKHFVNGEERTGKDFWTRLRNTVMPTYGLWSKVKKVHSKSALMQMLREHKSLNHIEVRSGLMEFDELRRTARDLEDRYSKHIKRYTVCLVASLFFAFVNAELMFLGSDTTQAQGMVRIISGVAETALCVTAVCNLRNYYRVRVKQRLQMKYVSSEHATIFEAGLSGPFYRDAAMCLTHCCVWPWYLIAKLHGRGANGGLLEAWHFDPAMSVYYRFLVVVYFASQAKILTLWRVFRHLSPIFNNRFIFLAKLNNMDYESLWLNGRMALELYPFSALALISFTNTILSAQGVSMCERMVNGDEYDDTILGIDPHNELAEKSYSWRRWIFHIVMNNFGGNVRSHPVTPCGQAVVSASLLVGNVILAVLIAILTNSIRLRPNEELVVKLAKLDMLNGRMKRVATVCLQRAWRAKLSGWDAGTSVQSFHRAIWMMRQIRLSREDEKRGTTSPSTAALDAISFLDGKVESMNETLETMSRQINTTLTSMQTQIKSVSSVFGE